MVGVELRLETPTRPAEQLGHASADGDRAVQAPASTLPDPGPSEQHVLEGHGELVGDRVMKLGDEYVREAVQERWRGLATPAAQALWQSDKQEFDQFIEELAVLRRP